MARKKPQTTTEPLLQNAKDPTKYFHCGYAYRTDVDGGLLKPHRDLVCHEHPEVPEIYQFFSKDWRLAYGTWLVWASDWGHKAAIEHGPDFVDDMIAIIPGIGDGNLAEMTTAPEEESEYTKYYFPWADGKDGKDLKVVFDQMCTMEQVETLREQHKSWLEAKGLWKSTY